jgi:hypothetical protein
MELLVTRRTKRLKITVEFMAESLVCPMVDLLCPTMVASLAESMAGKDFAPPDPPRFRVQVVQVFRTMVVPAHCLTPFQPLRQLASHPEECPARIGNKNESFKPISPSRTSDIGERRILREVAKKGSEVTENYRGLQRSACCKLDIDGKFGPTVLLSRCDADQLFGDVVTHRAGAPDAHGSGHSQG